MVFGRFLFDFDFRFWIIFFLLIFYTNKNLWKQTEESHKRCDCLVILSSTYVCPQVKSWINIVGKQKATYRKSIIDLVFDLCVGYFELLVCESDMVLGVNLLSNTCCLMYFSLKNNYPRFLNISLRAESGKHILICRDLW